MDESVSLLLDDLADRFPEARVEVTEFPSGAFSVDVVYCGRLATLQARGRQAEFGVSTDVALEDTFCGHDRVYEALEDAAVELVRCLEGFRNEH